MHDWFRQEGFVLISGVLGTIVLFFAGLNQVLTFTRRVREEIAERKKKALMAKVETLRSILASHPDKSLRLPEEMTDLQEAGRWLVGNGEAENLSTGPEMNLIARRFVNSPPRVGAFLS